MITVFTNGCFDIIHPGHIHQLEESSKFGDRLIVGLNSDNSVSRLKGSDRPINDEQSRKTILEALRCVDEVIIFEEDTPFELIKKIKPDIITKGGDYRPSDVVGSDIVKNIVIIPYLDGKSTTNIIEKKMKKMKDRHNGYVPKGWGSELIWVTNDKYCGKFLKFNSGAKFSMHFHAEKDEAWRVIDGEFLVHWIDTADASTHTEKLAEGDTWHNPPLLPHQIECISAGTIIEVSTPDSIQDNYRVFPGDSQA